MKNNGRMSWIFDSENAKWDELGRVVITSVKGKVLHDTEKKSVRTAVLGSKCRSGGWGSFVGR